MGRTSGRSRTAYTLVELMIVITVMGIAGALITPAFSQTGALRVQSAVRQVVADITNAQSDAIAFQRGMGIIFYPEESRPRYVVAEVSGGALDPDLNRVLERTLQDEETGGTVFEDVHLTDNTLVFDGLGGPVESAASSAPAPTGWIDLFGSNQRFRIKIEAYTGRVTVVALNADGNEQ